MRLLSRVESYFDSSLRQLGEDCFRGRRVQVLTGAPAQVIARVRDKDVYEVEVVWKNEKLQVWCDCANFDAAGKCEHIWAALLAAAAYGYMWAVPDRPIVMQELGLDESEKREEAPASGGFQDAGAPKAPPTPPKPPAWRRQLDDISRLRRSQAPPSIVWPPGREILYVVQASPAQLDVGVSLNFLVRDRKLNGEWTRPKELRLASSQLQTLPDSTDREILAAICGSQEYYYSSIDRAVPVHSTLQPALAKALLPRIAATGRCFLRLGSAQSDVPVVWEGGDPWTFELELERHGRSRWMVAGALQRGEERIQATEPALAVAGGLLFHRERVGVLDEGTPLEWMSYLRKGGRLEASDQDRDELLRALLTTPSTPRVKVPPELTFEEIRTVPRPALRIVSDREAVYQGRLRAELWFDYDDRSVAASERHNGFFDSETRRFLARDAKAEADAVASLVAFGLKRPAPSFNDPEPDFEILASRLPHIVRDLVHAGWRIEADGKAFRRPGDFRMGVASGIDWFELQAEVTYGETSAKLPALLQALRRGEYMVRLDDGTYGLLPEDWLRRFAPFAGMGQENEEHIRFGKNQAGLLDALLATAPEATFDEAFARVREQLRSFEGVRAACQPEGFSGELRGYQREGLGWMYFLRDFGFGGCLADDMGVGKTAQVLALLDTRRELRGAGEAGTSLVVVPKSLIFNWKQEAARFTPQIRILDHTGSGRDPGLFEDYDLVLTTYGTLRRDALRFRDFEFDYVVLDEAQAIKNAESESAKAARLLHARYRLAMSGTPVENHLGELWSLFEFLNPGMLGAASVFRLTGGMKNPDEETRRLLAQAVRPFILRRTKQQVAPELPEKTEQTIYCELDGPQRKLYDELRAHYRNTLLGRVERVGLAKSKIQVLEALLRLRQAACHPGLLDAGRSKDPSAKLETLLAQLREILDEGHKALVFSQFTSLLRIVRDRLDAEGIVYEYLDGATQDRQARVERFQTDPACPLFLISLKAGGLGLNLTAAEYVFLLDPWWNPAVEAQAVDRAHRIGQSRPVFAYRLIAKDTVEEKVLDLQQTKRALAEATIGEDNSLIRDLKREDLELLLS